MGEGDNTDPDPMHMLIRGICSSPFFGMCLNANILCMLPSFFIACHLLFEICIL